MKTPTSPSRFRCLPVLLAVLVFGGSLPAQEPAPEPAIAAAARFDASQLDQLLGPIALYPDVLIAIILPASTVSSDVVLAARFLQDGGEPAQAENQPWDESVRALAHYPDVVKWMDENLAWTKQLGEAFVAQPTEVMNAVQRLRARAQTAGSLVTTPQQQVLVEQSAITIVPAQPDVIHVPYYDPEIVYVPRTYYSSSPFISFGLGYSTGFWLSYNLDWGRRRICAVHYSDRERYWRERPDYWRRPFSSVRAGYVSPPHYTWAPRAPAPRSGYSSSPRNRYSPRPPTQVYRPNPPAQVSRPPGVQNPRWQSDRDNRGQAGASRPSLPSQRQNFNGPRLQDETPAPNVVPTASPLQSGDTARATTPARPGSPGNIANRNALPTTSTAPAVTRSWNRGQDASRGSGTDSARIRGTAPTVPAGPQVAGTRSLPATVVVPPLRTAGSVTHAPRQSSAPAYTAPRVNAPQPSQSYSAPAYTAPRVHAPQPSQSYSAPVYTTPRVAAPQPSQTYHAPVYTAPQVAAPQPSQPQSSPVAQPAQNHAPSASPSAPATPRTDDNNRRGRDRWER